jgi:signal transduction histidine kinase
VGAIIILAWAGLASLSSVIVERDNGAATLNSAHPDDWELLLLLLLLAVAGLLVVKGRRAVKAGYLLLLMGAATSTAFLAHALAVAALVRGHDGPAAQALVWLATWLFVPAIGMLPFVPALWPENRITSAWLRLPTVLAAVCVAAMAVGQAVAPDFLDGVGPALPPVPNPLGVPQAAAVVDVITRVGAAAVAAYTAAVLVDLVLRYVRGGPRLRGELRLLVFVVVGLPLALAAGAALAAAGGVPANLGMIAAGGVVLLGGLALTLIQAERAVRRWERAVAQRRRTVEDAEYERRRIRRDLHDGLGPLLAALRLQLEAVHQALPSTADEATDRLTRVEGTLTAALEELHCIVGGLRPAALDELGLSGALTTQGRAVSVPGGSAPLIDVIIDPTVPMLPDAVEVAIVRVSGEALANAVRHGKPSRCTVSLLWCDGQAVLRVEDDGVGMTTGRTGHGLSTMRERVEELGGSLTIGPTSPRGTTVSASIPVAQASR